MNTLEYKGFLGTVAFSEEDNVFFGKIEGINGLVNFEGESVDELKSTFYNAVDDYIIYCNENNIEQRNRKCVSKEHSKRRIIKETLEVCKANPWAAPKTCERLIVLKCS